jgi:hypothetical protein
MSMLGGALLGQQRFAEAEPLLLAAYDGLKHQPHILFGVEVRCETLERIVSLYEGWHAAEPGNGYEQKAAIWRAKLAEFTATPQPADPASPPAAVGSQRGAPP